jgi:hypothetical protein
MPKPATLAATAHHEAGHAVAALLASHVGLPPRDVGTVTVIRDGDALGMSTPEPLGYNFWPDPGDLEGKAVIEASIVSTLAGPLAEAHHDGRTMTLWAVRFFFGSPGHDGAQVEALARPLTTCKAELNAYLAYLWQRTRALSRVPNFWPSVDAVATALEDAGTLSGAQVRALIVKREDAAALRYRENLQRYRYPPTP